MPGARVGDLCRVLPPRTTGPADPNVDRFVTVVERYVGQAVPGTNLRFEISKPVSIDWVVTSARPLNAVLVRTWADGSTQEVDRPLSHVVMSDTRLQPMRPLGEDETIRTVEPLEVTA